MKPLILSLLLFIISNVSLAQDNDDKQLPYLEVVRYSQSNRIIEFIIHLESKPAVYKWYSGPSINTITNNDYMIHIATSYLPNYNCCTNSREWHHNAETNNIFIYYMEPSVYPYGNKLFHTIYNNATNTSKMFYSITK